MNKQTTIDFELTAAAATGAAGSGLSLRQLQRPLSILTTPGYDLSVPIVYATANDGLATGEYKNASRLATQIGISKSVLSDLLAMLNKPVKEIERLLFEVK